MPVEYGSEEQIVCQSKLTRIEEEIQETTSCGHISIEPKRIFATLLQRFVQLLSTNNRPNSRNVFSVYVNRRGVCERLMIH